MKLYQIVQGTVGISVGQWRRAIVCLFNHTTKILSEKSHIKLKINKYDIDLSFPDIHSYLIMELPLRDGYSSQYAEITGRYSDGSKYFS